MDAETKERFEDHLLCGQPDLQFPSLLRLRGQFQVLAG
jgi:hypothetical protein